MEKDRIHTRIYWWFYRQMREYGNYRWIIWWYQRITRGFSDRACWGLDHTIAEFTLPRLKLFRKIAPECGIPTSMFEEGSYINAAGNAIYHELSEDEHNVIDNKAREKWIAILDDMVYAMECCVDESFDSPYSYDDDHGFEFVDDEESGYKRYRSWGMNCDKDKQKIRDERIARGLGYFGKYFQCLWW
jgi:hypothetical protein